MGWNGKKGFDPGLFGSLPDRVRRGLFPQEKIDGLNNDRFAGTRFSGEDIESLGKREAHPIDQGQIPNLKLVEQVRPFP
jgi:hypothetical protein